ncbi:S8 family serine peptidase [filamentous cyanobacterium LEGE 11480]|uniref:S8 family serine peptidase n=1 Tax=Romeriopsis navalis LEGE 11480 TaxID=2777977 RepID=A0A928Z5T7_9CYAN|nr:S8 family serine peptidase [Romeriopsis navalis]MBE9031833.1 S8 family serine peptidase [Romeriopsis navalis LEGE 11480]
MSTKVLVTTTSTDERQQLSQIGCEVLAEYPSSVLARCTDAQYSSLVDAGLEITPLEVPELRVAGTLFAFSEARSAEVSEPLNIDPNRTAYYLVELIGPPKSDWLKAIQDIGGRIQANLSDFTLLVGLLPSQMTALNNQSWIEAITPYRPAMKVSPQLRANPTRTLRSTELQTLNLAARSADEPEQVEISVFEGEDISAIANEVEAVGGTILSQTTESIKAVMSVEGITALAKEQSVEAIQPSVFNQFYNDRAATIMAVPSDRTFADLPLLGTGQTVAVADSGLDTGQINNIHADIQGRVVDLQSWPTGAAFAPYTNDPVGNDDGPADFYSGHGTHVAGSVLGNGAAAIANGAGPVPKGIAPEAKIYFQAVEQNINWKSLAELRAVGLRPFTRNWPPPAASLWGLPDDLTPLFDSAYQAGARIHTNSWGASVAGRYTENSRTVDRYVWEHRDMLILFAAGNEGVDRNGSVLPDSMGSPGTAKNCVTVGASENNRPATSVPTPGLNRTWSQAGWSSLNAAGHVSDNSEGMAAFSSRGPTDDGRIKPDLVAPGTNILSMRSTVYRGNREILWGDLAAGDALRDKYCWSGGTSMSTPLVAGAAAVIRQYLIEQREHYQPNVKPSAALIKALLLNGAIPMAGQYANEIPSSQQNSVCGFGRANITNSLLQQAWFDDELESAVETGEIRIYKVQPIDNTQPMKITLVWTDAPGPVGVGQIQNKLYLQLKAPDGTIFNGDVTAYPTVQNNTQKVVIENPVNDTYELRVRGVSVTRNSPGVAQTGAARQDFAVAAANLILAGDTPPPPSVPEFRITNIFTVPPRSFWSSRIFGAEVVKTDGSPASPQDGIEVTMNITQGDREVQLDRSLYDRQEQYFLNRIWRIQFWGLRSGNANFTVQVFRQGVLVAEASETISL